LKNEGEPLLKLLGSEWKSSERRKPQSGEDLEEIRNNMNFEGEF